MAKSRKCPLARTLDKGPLEGVGRFLQVLGPGLDVAERLEGLPEFERAEWATLWTEVDALLNRGTGPKKN